MSIFTIILIIIAILVALLGIAGTVLPSLPGPPLCFVSMVIVYAVGDHHRSGYGLHDSHSIHKDGRRFEAGHLGNYHRYFRRLVLYAVGTDFRSIVRCFYRRIH